MLLHKETESIQAQLGEYCKTGKLSTDISGTVADRLPHYRRLVFNVIKDALSSAYPLSKKLLGDEAYVELCFQFFSEHNCQATQIFRMTGELYEFVDNSNKLTIKKQYPFLTELMQFEWTEMEMYMMEDLIISPSKKDGDWLSDQIILNPEYRLLQFEYPVFKKKPLEIAENDKALYYCYAYREPTNKRVLFLDISPLVAVILSQISEGLTLETIFKELNDSRITLTDAQKEAVISFLKTEYEKGLLIGFN